jgi:hypothetical protein
MQKRDATYLVLGILITAVASCRPAHEDSLSTLEPEWVETSPAGITPSDEAAPTTAPAEPSREPPLPLPLPTGDDWQPLGSAHTGLSLSIPPTWVNLTEQVNVPAMGNRLGINVVFAAESERTGRSLLAGKPFTNGAYVSGLIVAPPAGQDDPAAALVDLLITSAPSAVRLTPITPIQSANGVEGITVDVGDGPLGLNIPDPNDLRTRVALFMPPAADGDAGGSWIALLLSASAGQWEQHAALFERMLDSVSVYHTQPGGEARAGNVVVRGALEGDQDQVSASLEGGASDLWTFRTSGGRYASLFLQPEDPRLDLTLTLLGPDRQPVARVENGYAGVTESTTDLWLSEPGNYLVEVSDFAGDAGRYTLSLALSDQPQYGGGGTLAFGQTLQGQLPANGRHYWVFPGAAQQRISIVVEPEAPTFDAILELYGPDGGLLITLDEGFSGDPELVSGFELPAAGEYAIVVRSFSPQGGSYILSLDEGDRQITNFYDAGDLTYGSVRQESLQRREAQAWFLQGKAGDHILIRVTPLSAGLDLDVWLLDNGVERVAAVDEFAAGEPETIEMTLSADGQYIVLVRDFNGEPGEYEIALGAAPVATPETAGALSYGDAIIGAIRPGIAVAWTFNAQDGDVIDIEVQAGDTGSDIVLQLQGPDGLTALEVDQTPAGGDEAIRAYAIPTAGQWQVVMREFFGGSANYRLTLARAR